MLLTANTATVFECKVIKVNKERDNLVVEGCYLHCFFVGVGVKRKVIATHRQIITLLYSEEDFTARKHQ